MHAFYSQIENLKKAASDNSKKRQEEKRQAEVYESHSKFMKSKVNKHLAQEVPCKIKV